MGLYDTITVWPRGGLHCAAGHALLELQTKSLDCEMREYLVVEGALHRVVGPESVAVASEEGQPVLRRTWRLETERRSATVLAYASCASCRPVLYLAPHASWGDQVAEREPWAEWRLELVDGRLAELAPVRLDTRDDVRTALRTDGLEVLDDDERLARLHFARRGEPRR